MRDRYVDLYEFAPVGYITLTRAGTICEANLTGAALLGVERETLLNDRFCHFVTPGDSDQWEQHFLAVLQRDGRQSCDLRLRRADGFSFDARITSLRSDDSLSSHVPDDLTLAGKSNASSLLRIIITDITEDKRKEIELTGLAAHLQTVREEEKTRFARDIHDDLGGALTAMRLETYWLAKELSANENASRLLKHTELLGELVDNAMDAMRRIINDLRPAMLDDLGLMAALENQTAQFNKSTGIQCQLDYLLDKDDEIRLSVLQSTHLYRILQETLTNVKKHSHASKVAVEVHCDAANITMSISDDGCGAPESHVAGSNAYGMLGMKERVAQLGGKLGFGKTPGGGFSVTVQLPLQPLPSPASPARVPRDVLCESGKSGRFIEYPPHG